MSPWMSDALVVETTRGVEMRRSTFGLAVVFVLVWGAGCGSGSGGGAAKFTTSVPGDTKLGDLTDAELATLCADGAKFATDPAHLADNCRLAAFLSTAFTAAFMSGATDASLQMTCSETYGQCLNPSVDAGQGAFDGGAGPSCARPAANCAATVAEYSACINDQASQTHAAASAVPACSSITLSSVAPSDGGTTGPSLSQPASCQLVQSKCSGLADAAQAFVGQYCALIEPCCTQGGLTSQCTSQVTGAAQGGTFDPNAAASCLAALTTLQGGADYCGGLVVSSGSWSVIPACAPVFQAMGVTAAGQPCNQGSDCAPGPNGGAVCLTSFVGGEDGGAPTLTSTCQQLTGRVGDACFGTAAFGAISSNPTQTGAICDQSQGVFCDDQTSLCVATRAVGGSCNSYDMCDPVTAYCNLSNANVCAARLPLGATCVGGLFNECAGTAYCDETSKKCVAPGGAGAACSTANANSGQCLSGFCNAGACTNPLEPLCL
jgi:hypothetical protein